MLKLKYLTILFFCVLVGEENWFKIVYTSPVKLWQKLSYSTPILDCQFEPSCSNYLIHAVDSTGIVTGTIIGADRIIRCNPGARHYHLQRHNPKFYDDGRLIDHVSFNHIDNPNNKFLKYAIIPGFGRYKSDREIDGLFSFLIISSSIYKGLKFQNEKPILSGFYFSVGLVFWIADFYGTWRYSNQKN